MDNISIDRDFIRIKKLINEQSVEQAIDADITLPEYYQDIVRILKCSVHPVVNSVAVSGENVSADGVAYVKIIYSGEEQNIYCYEMSYPFSRGIDISGLTADSKVLTSCRIESNNCRAVTSRRIDVHAILNLSFQVIQIKESEAVNEAGGNGIELLSRQNDVLSSINVCEKSFSVLETVEVPENLPSVLRVLRCDANPIVNEIKIISNKIMLKGEAPVSMLYIPEDGSTGIHQAKFNLVFNEILEVPGIEETHICDLALAAKSVDADIQAKGGGEARTLDLTLRMLANIDVNEVLSINTAIDSYSTDYDVNIEREKVNKILHYENVDENFILKSNVDLSDISPDKIIDVSVLNLSYKTVFEEQTATLSGDVTLGVFYQTSDANIGYREKNIKLQYDKTCAESCDKVVFKPAISVLANNYKFDENSLDVKVELVIKGTLYLLEDEEIISSVSIVEDSKHEKEDSGLIIYYADKGEKLWDIAKKYNISSKMLKTENNIDTEVLEETCTLLILCI